MPVVNTLLSYSCGVLPASLGISLFTYIHNEFGSGNHWFGKQSCTAILYALFEMGATSVAGELPVTVGKVQLHLVSDSRPFLQGLE